MMLEASPPPPFKVVEAHLLFQFLVVSFDSPSQFRKSNELRGGDVVRHCRQPCLRRIFLSLGPFDDQPLYLARRSPPVVSMRWANAEKRETRSHVAASALTPSNRLPKGRRQLPSETTNRYWPATLRASHQCWWSTIPSIGPRA